MDPYAISNGGNYEWHLSNGICDRIFGEMDVTVINCNGCNINPKATIRCTPDNPASYSITIVFNSPAVGTSFTLGTDMGPITPFSGTLTATGIYTTMLTFTTLYLSPPPTSVMVEVSLTLPDGSHCFQKVSVKVPNCNWVAERTIPQTDTAQGTYSDGQQPVISTAMLVFPNPASGNVTISYDYGTGTYTQRDLAIYEEMGRKTQYNTPQNAHGNWTLNTTDWTPGIYIVRMEGDGQALQTQKIVVAH